MRRNLWIMAGLLVLLAAALYDNYGTGLLSGLGFVREEAAEQSVQSQSVSALVAEKSLKPGTKAPTFTLTGMDGNSYKVGGKREVPLMLNFWASWCGPCQEEAPDLVKLGEKYAGRFDIYAVNVTFYDKLDEAKEFVEKYGYKFPVLLDKKGEIYGKYNGIAFPTNVLIDKDGNVVDVIVGTLSPEELEAKIEKLLET